MVRITKWQTKKVMASVLSAAMVLTNMFGTEGIALAEEISEEAVVEEITEETADETLEIEPSEETVADEDTVEEVDDLEDFLQQYESSEYEEIASVAYDKYADGFEVWFNTDGTTSVTAGQYSDYPIYFGENMAAKTNAITVDGVKYYSVQGATNPKADGANPNGAIPTAGAYMMVQAPADGLISVYGYAASGKPFYATKGATPYLTDDNAFCNDLSSYMIPVASGEEWYFYAQGSKAQFIGVTFELPKPEHDFDLSWDGEFGDSVITFTNVRTKKAVEVTPADSKITLNEGYKYTVTTNSADYILNINGEEESVLDLTDMSSLPAGFALSAVAAAKHTVTGSIEGLPTSASVTSVTFTDKSGATTVATVNNANRTYSVSLKNGEYTTSAVVSGADGYTVYDHVLVEGLQGEEIANDVYFYAPAATYSSEYKAEITVGKNGDYATISEALAAVKAMTRTAGQYVTLVLTDSEYVEQVIVDSENVKMVAAEGVDPIIRWYYGIGYKYYSIDATGYYNIKNANDKYEMNYAQRWGAVVRVKSAGFIAEGINFINTFNIEVVEEELGDSKVGSSAEYGQSISGSLQERVAGLDVANGTNVERAAAVALDAANAEFYKCSFISSQDTLYTGSSAAYFNDCYISGQTDYIFGNTGCSAVFDNCELNWLGYTAGSKAGYITATRGDYLFRGCNITKNTSSGYTVTPGYFGRPWGNTPSVVFIGCTIEDGCMNSAGWYEMSGVKPEDVVFREFGNCTGSELSSDANIFFKSTYAAADESAFALTLAEAEKLADPQNDSEYLGAWTPVNHIDSAFDLSAVAEWGEPGEEEEPGEEAEIVTKIFDAAVELAALNKSAAISVNTSYQNGAFKVVNKDAKRANSSTYSIELGAGRASELQFSVIGFAKVTVVASSTGGSNTSLISIFDANDVAVPEKKNTTSVYGSSATELVYEIDTPGTYTIGAPASTEFNRGVRIIKVTIEDIVSGERPPRADWAGVKAPVIGTPTVLDGTITIPYTMLIDYDGADSVTVEVIDEQNNVIKELSGTKTDGTVEYVPSRSGKYTFRIAAVRENENDKAGNTSSPVDFILPLKAPAVNSLTNKGNGSVEVAWDATPEAVYYIITVDGTEYADTKTAGGTSIIIDGLTVGQQYIIGIKAARDDSDKSAIGVTSTVNVKNEVERTWGFTAYGSSTDTKNNGYTGNINDGQVTVFSKGGKGKIVPNSSDGLAFYYTVMDPETENFTLEADITVDNWTFSNGQEGFGIMVADTIGIYGDSSTYWNNSIMAIASKVEYFYANGAVTADTNAAKISMKLGIGTLARLGVTSDDFATFKSTGGFVDSDGKTVTLPVGFSTETTTLETSCGSKGAGTYNIIGNATNTPDGTVANPITTLHLSIQRNNTGYIVKYSDAQGNVIGEKLIYDLEREALTRIDADRIYVGFFAARNAEITVTNAKLTVIAPEDDEAALEHEVEYVVPNYVIESADFSNTSDYDLVYYGNADGKLNIVNSKNEVIANNIDITAKTKYHFNVNIDGSDTFTVKVTPDPEYMPGKYQRLENYDEVTIRHTVTVKSFVGETIYVSPRGTASGSGSRNFPMDVYTAVKVAQPGQKIILAGGTYNLSSTLKIERGINGTASAMIYMIADPNSSTRPVFDFGSKCAGMIIAGDYWYFSGFDVTKSANGQKGIQLSGNNNILDGLRTYRNGNTGIQVSRYLGTDNYEDWPSNNLILNCTSYLNADQGFEDADGFAAKLTIGDGNVFDGCISAFNADDGWDLFAKAETGPIGKVVIKNSVAFRNGYVIDDNGTVIKAGNGNGFKMGGESLSGNHTIYNSVAFANKAKGFDSNSCPDIKVYNCTSFDNESYNIAFYTNNAVNTAFRGTGILSYKKTNDVVEQLKLLGTQNNNDVYGPSNYFCYGAGNSYNSENAKVADDWFVNLDTAAVLTAAEAAILDGSFGIYGISASAGVVRRSDGSINMNGYLEATAKVPEGVGARLSGLSEDYKEFAENMSVGLALNEDGTIGLKYQFSVADKFAGKFECEIYVAGKLVGENDGIAISTNSSNGKTQYTINVSLAAKQMADNVELIVRYENKIVENIIVSAAKYAELLINDNSGKFDAYKDMLKAMLNYGTAAQKYFDYNTGAPANSCLTPKDKLIKDIDNADADRYIATSISNSLSGIDGIEYLGSSLVLNDKIAVRHYFAVSASKRFEFTNGGNAIEVNEVSGVSGVYYIEIKDISASMIYQDITVTCKNVTDGTNALINYSVINYIVAADKQSDNVMLKELVKALYSYANSTVAFLSEN